VSVICGEKVRWNKKWWLYCILFGGGKRAERAVAIVVHKSIVRSVVKKIVCNDRIIALKLKAEPVIILIMQVYMATSEYEDDEVEKLYGTIHIHNDIFGPSTQPSIQNIILFLWSTSQRRPCHAIERL